MLAIENLIKLPLLELVLANRASFLLLLFFKLKHWVRIDDFISLFLGYFFNFAFIIRIQFVFFFKRAVIFRLIWIFFLIGLTLLVSIHVKCHVDGIPNLLLYLSRKIFKLIPSNLIRIVFSFLRRVRWIRRAIRVRWVIHVDLHVRRCKSGITWSTIHCELEGWTWWLRLTSSSSYILSTVDELVFSPFVYNLRISLQILAGIIVTNDLNLLAFEISNAVVMA